MNTAGIIFLVLGIIAVIIPVIWAIVEREEYIMLFSLFSLIFFMLFCIVNWPDPTKNDVKDGKAIYVGEVNVGLNTDGDTIYKYSTYHIEWLPEWKYGRKH